MALNVFLSVLSLALLCCLNPTYGFSACDDVDVLFVVDTDSIMHASDRVLSLIDSIVLHGSSEDAGLSLAIYGDVPVGMDTLVVSLDETECIHRRETLEAAFIANLTSAFAAVQESNETRYVDLLDAFASATSQHKPQRKHHKRQVLAADSYSLGDQDDENEIFIFDFFNLLLPLDDLETDLSHLDIGAPTLVNRSDALCVLLDHDATHDDETMHFMLGQEYDRLDLGCLGEYPDNVFHNTFFLFDDDLLDPAEMERVFDITCPAVIDTPEFQGKVNLGNHVQWIDPSTVIECSLTLLSDNIDRPLTLDADSYMLVRDYLDDDDINTFQKGDYLMASPNVTEVIDEVGCWNSVYRIKDIEAFDDDNEDEGFVIRKLLLQIPGSPVEYIFNTNVKGGRIPVERPETVMRDVHSEKGRSLLSFLKLAGDGSISLRNLGFPSSFGGEWEKSFDGGVDWSTGSSPEFAFSGTGSLTLSAGFEFALDMSLDFEFTWDVLSADIHLFFVFNIDYGISLNLGAELLGQVEAAINDLIDVGQVLTFAIGPVPVIIKPFVSLSAKITTVPLSVKAGVECHYGETIRMGYEYTKETTFHAQYGKIRSNTRYTLGIKKQWNNIDALDTCVALNYEHGAGGGLTCVWFDYNKSAKRCRCYGAGVMVGKTTSSSGTTAYIMNKKCGGLYKRKCDGCGTRIWVKNDGGSGCFPGWKTWRCISCPLFQKNTGWAEVNENERRIDERKKHDDNGCSPVFELNAADDEDDTCKVLQFGFDVEVSLKIGCNLYSVVTVYARAALEIPFRVNVPEFRNAICSGAKDSCDDDLLVSTTIAMDLSFYLGVEVDFSTLGDIINTVVDETQKAASAAGQSVDFGGVEVKLGTFEILSVTGLTCDPLKDVFDFLGEDAVDALDTLARDKCCEDSSARSVVNVINDAQRHRTVTNGDEFDDADKWSSSHGDDEDPATPTGTMVVVIPASQAAILACVVAALAVVACITWRSKCCRREGTTYAKVAYVSEDTEAEENAIFNGGDEQL